MDTTTREYTLTKLEARLLGLSPTEADTVSDVLSGEKVHPQDWRSGARRHYELVGMSRGRIVKALAAMDISGRDIECGNDAPRGGAAGKWIRLSASGRHKSIRRLA